MGLDRIQLRVLKMLVSVTTIFEKSLQSHSLPSYFDKEWYAKGMVL